MRHLTSPSEQPSLERPEPHPGSTRPVLRVIQGGVTRRRRLEPPGAPRPAVAPAARAEDAVRSEETTICLRPIPAWLPRLW